jgi:VWFA-related protein
MKIRIPPAAIALVALLAQTFSAQQQPSSTPGVIRINVDLVQVDAVVTDSKGNRVTSLTADDFEVLQNGKVQKIRNFEFINVREPGVRSQPRAPGSAASIVLRPEQIRRTVAILIDDIGLSGDSIAHTREAIRKWVDNEMQPDDLVSITRTNAAMGALQQFTNNKRLLYTAIDRIKYQPGRVGTESMTNTYDGLSPAAQAELANTYLTGSLNAIRYVIRGLRDLPGRKSLILFAEDLSLNELDTQRQAIEDRVRQITDEANRSSVVIHAVDPRGAYAFVGGAEVAAKFISSQDGMVMLSGRTGGTFSASNDFGGDLRKAIDDGDGYYLMGYQPAGDAFNQTVRPKYNTIKVRVKRPGLKVRSRAGFYGSSDVKADPPALTRTAQLARALVSPFSTADIHVRLTAMFSESEKEEPYIKTMLHFDANDLMFTEGADGLHTAQIDIAMVTIDADGNTQDTMDKTLKLTVEKDSWENVLKRGLVYSGPLPIKKPGPYQLRVALRDADSMRLGSAMQFIDVPDVKSGRLALSGIVVSEDPPDPNSPEGTPAVRIFKSGGAFTYAYEILNARNGGQEHPPLDWQMQLYRESELVYQSDATRLNTDSDKDAKRLAVGGKMQLTKIPPGEYVLQVTLSDGRRKDKNRLAAQTIDFEVR